MCLPKPPNPAPATVPVPTDQAAQAFDFGGNQAGANIGRLALRLTSGNQSSGAASNSSTANGATTSGTAGAPVTPAAAAQTGVPASTAASGDNTSANNVGAYSASQRGGFNYAPNTALRQGGSVAANK